MWGSFFTPRIHAFQTHDWRGGLAHANFIISVYHILFFKRRRWKYREKNEMKLILAANHSWPFHMPYFLNGWFDILSKSMHKIPTKFFGNPVEAKSELLYLHYQIFGKWGKARCSGRHKGIDYVSETRPWELWAQHHMLCVRRTRSPDDGAEAEPPQTDMGKHPLTHSCSFTLGLRKKTRLKGEGCCPFSVILDQLPNYYFYCGILYFWKVLFNQTSVFSKTLGEFSVCYIYL